MWGEGMRGRANQVVEESRVERACDCVSPEERLRAQQLDGHALALHLGLLHQKELLQRTRLSKKR